MSEMPLHPFAIDGLECLLARDTKTDSSHGADGFDARFARCELLKGSRRLDRGQLLETKNPTRKNWNSGTIF